MKMDLPLQPLNREDSDKDKPSLQDKTKGYFNSSHIGISNGIGIHNAATSIASEHEKENCQHQHQHQQRASTFSQSKSLQDTDLMDRVRDQDINDQDDSELVRIYSSSLCKNSAECKRIDTIQSSRNSSGRQFVPFHYLHLHTHIQVHHNQDEDDDEPLMPNSNIQQNQHFLKPRLLTRTRTTTNDRNFGFLASVTARSLSSDKASAFDARSL